MITNARLSKSRRIIKLKDKRSFVQALDNPKILAGGLEEGAARVHSAAFYHRASRNYSHDRYPKICVLVNTKYMEFLIAISIV